MKTDEEIRNEVVLAFLAESIQNPALLNVVVNDGIVTLRGTVDSSSKKFSACPAVLKACGAVELDVFVLPAMDSGAKDDIERFF